MTNKAFSVNLNFDSYKDRVYAYWLGKNIGGTLGGPYEGVQHTLDVQGFSAEAGKPRPNDDLDLQLIWLHAVERLGPLAIHAQSLGEFWISLLPPNWNEYGIGRNNMKRGLPPTKHSRRQTFVCRRGFLSAFCRYMPKAYSIARSAISYRRCAISASDVVISGGDVLIPE